MGRSDRDTSSKTHPDPYTRLDSTRLDPPAPSASKLRRAPARLGALAITPGLTTTPSPSASTSKSVKRDSSNPFRDQTTLTQIDFVRRHESDDEFDYIGDSGRNTEDVIEIDDDEKDRDNGRDLDHRPPSASRRKSNRGVRFDSAPPKLKKKSSVLSDGSSAKGRRKSSEKKDKGVQKEDNTLTQMKYVQRIDLAGSDLDNAKLEYAYITPKKRDTERHTVNAEMADDSNQSKYITEPTSEHKRIKLSPASEAKVSHKAQEPSEKKVKSSPTTPRKPIRTEIPSSQSPESPGVAFMTSSQFRTATGLPEPCIKKEQVSSHEATETSDPVQPPLFDEKLSLKDSKGPSPLPTRRESSEITPKANGIQKPASDSSLRPDHGQHPAPSQRTVVYETDAESDYGDFEDELPDVPISPKVKDSADLDDNTQGENETIYPETESQELPTPPIPEQNTHSGPLPSDSNLLSDASICYQRLHPDTQFPLEPVPTINTQKMAELFPEESNGLHTLTPSPPSSPQKARQAPSFPTISQTQDLDEGQTDSQAAGKPSTDLIPESSPVARHDDTAHLNRRAPAARDVVVQVESSQPADRARRQTTAGQDSGPRKMLSRSQILTSSVMESIPVPFWLSSQDSVGEPYSQPDPP